MFEHEVSQARSSTSTRSRRSTTFATWAEYNEGLRLWTGDGDLTVWSDEEAIANWKAGEEMVSLAVNGSIQTWRWKRAWAFVRMVYKLIAYRQTEGFLHSITSLSRARYRDPGLLDVVSALERCSARSCGFRKKREHSTRST